MALRLPPPISEPFRNVPNCSEPFRALTIFCVALDVVFSLSAFQTKTPAIEGDGRELLRRTAGLRGPGFSHANSSHQIALDSTRSNQIQLPPPPRGIGHQSPVFYLPSSSSLGNHFCTISAPVFALSLCGSLCLQCFPSRIAPSRFPGEWRLLGKTPWIRVYSCPFVVSTQECYGAALAVTARCYGVDHDNPQCFPALLRCYGAQTQGGVHGVISGDSLEKNPNLIEPFRTFPNLSEP